MRGGREGGEVVEHRLRRGRAERSRLERRSSISKRSSSRVANETSGLLLLSGQPKFRLI